MRESLHPRFVKYGLPLGVGVLAALLVALLLFLSLFEPLEQLSYDMRVRLFTRKPASAPGIVLVLVDQKSLDFYEKEGKVPWPWPRDFYSILIQALTQWNAKAVVFDLIFSEPKDEDSDLIEATRASGRVYHSIFFRKEKADLPELETGIPGFSQRRSLKIVLKTKDPFPDYNRVNLPVPGLEEASKGVGSINVKMDEDKVTRWWQPLYVYRGASYPAIELSVAMDLLSVSSLELTEKGRLRLGSREFPLSLSGAHQGQMAVRYYGPERTFPSYSFSNVVQGFLRSREGLSADIAPEEFREKIVLIGTNIEDVDLKKTPFATLMPGVEYHADVLANLLEGICVRRLPRTVTVGITFVLAVAAAFLFFKSEKLVWWSLLALPVLGAAVAAALVLYRNAGLWVEMVAPLSGFLLAGVSSVVLSHYMVGRERRFLRRAFEFYLHPEIVKELVRRPEMLKLGGVRREITVFFSDLAGFTSFSEHLDPETLVAVLNRYLSEMSDIIMEEGGTLDKYVGDAIMAFWGAPLEHPDHALRACKAAVLCQKKLDEMRPVFQSMGVAELQARIGINTGPAVVGNMGSEARFNYTAMGDTVNLASRLEGVNKMYGTRILISDATFLPAGGGIEARELDNLRVKGKKLPVKVYELLGMKGEIPDSKRRVLEAYGKALDCYWKRKFEESAAVLNQILGSEPADTPSRVMLERCLKNIAYPPPDDWDGAFTLDTK